MANCISCLSRSFVATKEFSANRLPTPERRKNSANRLIEGETGMYAYFPETHLHALALTPLHPTPGDGLPPEIGQQTTNSPSRSHDKEIYGPFSESSFDITQPLLWNDVAGVLSRSILLERFGNDQATCKTHFDWQLDLKPNEHLDCPHTCNILKWPTSRASKQATLASPASVVCTIDSDLLKWTVQCKVSGEVKGTGVADSKAAAKEEAAKQALKALGVAAA
ncbi:hypothetical protein B0H14DRAFT_2557942 [Mycena olivaceomarginata]|nr:hypothetical protein B0H14DRAFT_2557942 [Mycena olivaceomarginata]